jgi:hypothetical protein
VEKRVYSRKKLMETTTIDEEKCLKRSRLRYNTSNDKRRWKRMVFEEEDDWEEGEDEEWEEEEW